MRFDLEKEGPETVLLPWQVELMRWIWSVHREVDSRAAYIHIQGSETPMSRASSINFLNTMAEEGFLDHRKVTAKGGWKRVYRPSSIALDEETFSRTIAERIIEKARRELLEDEKQ